MCFSLIELNAEVFRNPEKDGTMTGGSLSGSAVMVRASLTDFAVGVDTVGDLRVRQPDGAPRRLK